VAFPSLKPPNAPAALGCDGGRGAYAGIVGAVPMLNPDAKADGFGCAAGASPPILN